MVQAPCGERGLYHSRAARDDRDGAFPLQGDTKRQDVTLCLLATRMKQSVRDGSALLAIRVEPWDTISPLIFIQG